MPPQVILLAGAPAASDVHPSSCTVHHFDGPICRFMGLPQHDSLQPHQAQASHAPWRALSLVRQPLHTGFTQRHHQSFTDLSRDFFTTANVSDGNDTTAPGDGSGTAGVDALTEFCEESLAQVDSQDLSQLTTTDTSFMTTTSTRSEEQPNQMAPPPIPPHLSDLEDVPPARYIMQINPQTVTVNLIVGIISIAQPRTVTTKWGKSMSLIEILVGDETKSGFAITFWLSRDAMVTSRVSRLRNQDVVLIQNVALHVFRGKVYGQSLRKDLTKVTLLWRRDGDGHYSTRGLARSNRAQSDPQREKTRQVKDWTLRFVGGRTAQRKTATSKKSWDEPPDDTQ
jgi:hypothetical protein